MGEKTKIELVTATVWNIGLRQKNEDSILMMEIQYGSNQGVLAIVCDGIGGLEEGERASGYIIENMEKWFYSKATFLKYGKISKKVCKSIERTIYQIHIELQLYGEKNNIRCGSTCSIFLMVNRKYQIFHYGDSRIYHWSEKNNIQCLTVDDVDAQGRGLTKAIGVGVLSKPYVVKGVLKKEESVLLCTDGFYRKSRREEMNRLMNVKGITAEETIIKKLNQIGRLLLGRGEKDNMSAILLGFVEK